MWIRPPLPGDDASCVSFCVSCVFSCVLRGRGHLPDSTPALPLQKESLSEVFHQWQGKDLNSFTTLPSPTLPTVLAVTITTPPPRSFPPVASRLSSAE